MGGRLVYLKNVVSLQLNPEKCIGCGFCTLVCPHGVFVRDNGTARIAFRDACMECGACARNCPADAIRVHTGVGCAQAVLNSMIGRSGEGCCSLDSGCC